MTQASRAKSSASQISKTMTNQTGGDFRRHCSSRFTIGMANLCAALLL